MPSSNHDRHATGPFAQAWTDPQKVQRTVALLPQRSKLMCRRVGQFAMSAPVIEAELAGDQDE
jgi:hypothetical protein